MLRSITKDGLKLIKAFEKFVPRIYLCPAGYPTIGYGHVISQYETAKFPHGIDEDTALKLLMQDVQVATSAVIALVEVPLSDNAFSSLVSFTFNVGSGAFQRSTLRLKVNRCEHDDVPLEFAKWVYAGCRKLPGLVRRREAEAAMYLQ